MKLPKNFAGMALGLVVVFLAIGRSVPRALHGGYSLGVIGPIVAVLIVGVFVVALTLGRSGRNKPQPPHRRHRSRR